MSTETNHPEHAKPNAGCLEDLVLEISDLAEAGKVVEATRLIEQHPEHAARLNRLLPAIEALATLDVEEDPSCGGTTGDARELGDFRLVREIGRGGMGIVYEAEQLSLGRRMALKVLPLAATLSVQQLERFKNEARLAASLKHPHIVSVHSVGVERGVHYYAMELVEGCSLAQAVASLRASEGELPIDTTQDSSCVEAPPSETLAIANLSTARTKHPIQYYQQVARLMADAADAVEYAHSAGIVHRDIKPGNLLLDADGNVHVTDFGLARLEADAGVTLTGDLLGTLRYMSPEQAAGNQGAVDYRTDIHALGATLYELLALRSAFDESDRAKLLRHVAEEVPRPLRQSDPGIPRELETIVNKSLEKDPSDRYQSAAALASDLRAYLHHRPLLAKRPTLGDQFTKWVRRHVAVVTTALAVSSLLIVGLATAFAMVSRSRTEAVQQRTVAQKVAQLADQQKALATQQRDFALQQHYVSSIRSAHSDWEAGNLLRMSDTLDELLPQMDLPDLRGWEWYYLQSLLTPDDSSFNPNLGALWKVQWSPDARLLAVTGRKGARIFEPSSRQPVQQLPDWQWLEWSPDGKFIVGVNKDSPRKVDIWDVGKKTLLLSTEVGNAYVTGFRWSPDGQQLAFTYRHVVMIWEIDEPKPKRFEITNEQGPIELWGLSWNPDGRTLLLCEAPKGYGSRLIHTWNPDTNELGKTWPIAGRGIPLDVFIGEKGIQVAIPAFLGRVFYGDWTAGSHRDYNIEGHPGDTLCGTWNLKGDRFVTGGADNLVRLWEPRKSRQLDHWAGHAGPVTSLDWSSTNDQIVSASADGTIRFWDTNAHPGALKSSADSMRFGDRTTTCWLSSEAIPLQALRKMSHTATPSLMRNQGEC